MKTYLFRSQCQNEIVVYIDQLSTYLKSNEFKPIGYSKEDLQKIYNSYTCKKNTPLLKKKAPVISTFRQKKCIIGGGSKFVEIIDTNLFKDQFVIGCNCWPLLYPCNWALIADTHLFIPELKRIYNELPNVKVAVNKVKEVPDSLYDRADLVWSAQYDYNFSENFNGKLFLDFSGTAALHLACMFGFKNILLMGIDYTNSENTYWYPKCSTYNNINTDGINKNINAIQEFYNVNIYQANPQAKTCVPILGMDEFIKL